VVTEQWAATIHQLLYAIHHRVTRYVKLHLGDKETKRQKDRHKTKRFVFLSFVSAFLSFCLFVSLSQKDRHKTKRFVFLSFVSAFLSFCLFVFVSVSHVEFDTISYMVVQ